MGSRADENKRLLIVTPSDLRQNHLSTRGLHNFLPKDCIGASTAPNRSIEICLDGLDETVKTHIGIDPATGKARSFFRGGQWVRRFFDHHHVRAGDELTLELVGSRRYRLSAEAKNGNGTTKRTAAEFFAGIGLVRLALENQGWDVVFANDIDPDKAEMYRHNWPQPDHLVVGDIHKIDPKDVPSCDLFTASFPCNDLSIAGKWEGLNGKESSAFWGFVDILDRMGKDRPHLVMLENVVGFLMSHRGRDFEQALKALNELGYAIDPVILNAVHWVPQSRARMFIVGRQMNGQPRRRFPVTSEARPAALTNFIVAHPEIEWDLSEAPSLPQSSKRLVDIIEDLPDDDPHWWNENRVDYFLNQMSPRHEGEAKRMIDGKSITYATAFRRVRNKKSMAELRTDGIAGCLRTPRGGSGRQILFKAGGGCRKVRLLTARECARLQGVPDTFAINVPLNQALFGFGDAVCVPAVEWVVSSVITSK